MKKLSEAELKNSATGSSCRSRTRSSRTRRSTTRARQSERSSTCSSAGGRSAAASPSASCGSAAAGPGTRRLRGVRRRQRETAVSTTMVFAKLLRNLIRDPDLGQAHRADHPRRGAHVRHGGAVPRGRHLRGARPEVRAGRLEARALVPREDRRPGARGGHHRGRLDGARSRPPAPATRRTATR